MFAALLNVTAAGAGNSAQLKSVSVKPVSVEGGKPIEVIIRLTRKGKVWVKLNSSDGSTIPVQANMPVYLNNVSSKSVYLDTNIISGSSRFVTIRVDAGAVWKTANVTVTPQGALGGSPGEEYSVYKIKSNNMRSLQRLAEREGFFFDSEFVSGIGSSPECSQRTTSTGIRLTANPGGLPGQVVDVNCKHRLFGGSQMLNSGWTLYKLVWSRINSPGTWRYFSRPRFGSRNPAFIVSMQSDFRGPIAEMELREVWLKGPPGAATWKEAFE